MREAVAFSRIARNAGANDIFPGRLTLQVAGNDVIEIELSAVENVAAVLAGIFIPLENIVPRKFDFLFRQTVKEEKHDHPGNANSQGNGLHHLRLGIQLRKIPPAFVVVGQKVVTFIRVNDLRLALIQ